MATNRFGYSDDFVLNNGKVGINSASPQEKLDVVGVVKGDRLKVAGVSSFTVYEGFLNSTQNIVENVSLNSGNGITGSLSGEVIVGTGITVTGIGSAISVQNYIESLKVYNTFTVPVGGTTDRPTTEKPGQLFFNRDFGTMEFWDGDRWRQVDNTTRSGRGVFGGGYTPTVSISSISYINISSTGNALNFGTLSTAARIDSGSFSNSTRGVFHLGVASPIAQTNILEYITIASEGNSIDFGDLTVARNRTSALSNSTRGIVAGGFTPSPTNTYFNILDYIQIQTLGNALDFGDLQNLTIRPGCVSSPTRGIFIGGITPSTNLNSISFVNISSTGNAVDFGGTNIFSGSYIAGGVSNGVRGIIAGGESAGSGKRKDIAYLTIASTGNAIYFGDLTIAKSHLSGCSSATRGVYVGGDTPSYQNTLEYITIASTGNAVDFGDDVIAASRRSACSDSHGGLGGF